jgi:hypothetical protein
MSSAFAHRLVCSKASRLCSQSHANTAISAQEHFSTVAQAEAQKFERLHYRWLTHASRLCDKRRRGDSNAPVVAFLHLWPIECRKREELFLQAKASRACRVIDPVLLPLHGVAGGSRCREFERGTHSFLAQEFERGKHSYGDTRSGVGGNVVGDKDCATTNSATAAERSTQHTEAEALDARARIEFEKGQLGATTWDPMRELQTTNGFCPCAVGFSGRSNERTGRQTPSCRNSSRSRDRCCVSEIIFCDRQERVLGQICRGRPKESDDGSEGFSENTLDEPSRRSADHKAIVPLPRGHPQRCQEHASTHADTNDECIDWGLSNDAFGNNPDRCTKSPSPQAEASCAERESPLGLDGVLEETKDHEPRAVERQSSKVANRIREYELKNAIPMPRHFRPSGHTRHDHDNRAHQSQLYREEKPEVDLIFPLHVRRFPRRISDGTPFRPETPLHRSIPDEEPYIHAPQPARSMPMLKDPPEHDPPPLAAPEVLGTPRGNHDGFAIASGYGHSASRNFAVRRNSRP